MSVAAPCKGCTDRFIGCHGKCDRYIDWRANKDVENHLEREERKARQFSESISWRNDNCRWQYKER